MEIMSGDCIIVDESDPPDFDSVHVSSEFQLCIVISTTPYIVVCTYIVCSKSGPDDDVQGGWLCTPYFVHICRPLDAKIGGSSYPVSSILPGLYYTDISVNELTPLAPNSSLTIYTTM